MPNKKLTKFKTKRKKVKDKSISLAKLASITTKSLSSAISNYKKNQEIKPPTKDEVSQTNDSMNQHETNQVEESKINDSVKQQEMTENKSNKPNETVVNVVENKQDSDQKSTTQKSDEIDKEANNNEVKE